MTEQGYIGLFIVLGAVLLIVAAILLGNRWYHSEKQVAKRKAKELEKEKEEKLRRLRISRLEDDENEVIPYTNFIYEDGNIYHFRIISRNSNSYHDLKCYKKEDGDYFQIGESEMITVDFTTNDIKKECEEIMKKAFPQRTLEDWDGIVGDVPDWLAREAKLKELLGNKDKETDESGTS